MTSEEKPCLPGCHCACGHTNFDHSEAGCLVSLPDEDGGFCPCLEPMVRLGKIHAPACPKNAKPTEPQGSEVCLHGLCEVVPDPGKSHCLKHTVKPEPTQPKSEPPIDLEMPLRDAEKWVASGPPNSMWNAGQVKDYRIAEALLALEAERDALAAQLMEREEESARRLSLIQQYEAMVPALKAENAELRAKVERYEDLILDWSGDNNQLCGNRCDCGMECQHGYGCLVGCGCVSKQHDAANLLADEARAIRARREGSHE